MLTNRELIEMIQKWLTFCESSWLFGSCGKVLHCELSYWANLMKKFSLTFWISWELLIDKKQLTLSSELSCWNHWCVFRQILKFDVVEIRTPWILILYRKPQWKNVLCICLLFFLTVTKIYDYILNIWTNSLWKCQMSARQNQDLREKCRLDFAEGHEKPLQSRKLRSSRRDLWNNIFWVQLERQGIFMVDLILACRTKKNKFDKWVFWQSSRHDVRAFYPDLFLCNCCQ